MSSSDSDRPPDEDHDQLPDVWPPGSPGPRHARPRHARGGTESTRGGDAGAAAPIFRPASSGVGPLAGVADSAWTGPAPVAPSTVGALAGSPAADPADETADEEPSSPAAVSDPRERTAGTQRAMGRASTAGVTATAGISFPAPVVPAPPKPIKPPRRPADQPPDARPPRSGRVRLLPGLRIGRHIASDADLEAIRPTSTGRGLVLGWGQDKQPVMVRLFRDEPTRVTLVGGTWISRVVAFRALALGARLAVFTSRPDIWRGFGSWATGTDDRVVVLPADRQPTVTATSLRPVLFLYDGELLAPTQRPDLGPWQTQLTVLRRLTAYGFPAIQESNLVALQRLDREEALAAASVLRLSDRTSSWLQLMVDEMLAILVGGSDEYLWVEPTDVERERFGPVTR
jgi:hypothetical protein